MLTNCWVIKLTQLLGEMHLLKCWAFCVPNMDGQYFAQLLNVLTIRPTLGKKLGIYLPNFFTVHERIKKYFGLITFYF